MTTYAPNFTPRLRVRYTAAGVQHSIQVRGVRGASSAVMNAKLAIIHDLFQNFSLQLASDFAFISADYALTDSEVWIPTTTPAAVTGSHTASDFTPMQKITSTIHMGRSAGSRARYSLYGIFWQTTNKLDDDTNTAYNGVVTGAENANVTANKVLADSYLASNAGVTATWYDRVTVKQNDALLKLVRRGTIS